MELRDYQQQALSKILWAKSNNLEGNDLVVLPTGAGKSVVIAHLAKSLTEPILILQPSKEILQQNYQKLCQYVNPLQVGIYSASMNEKTVRFFTFATIQSIYRNPHLFAHFRLIIIDECHLVNPKNLGGMFTKFLKDIGSPKVIGFTATPYRMDTAYFNMGKDDYGQPIFKATVATKLINRMKGFFWKRMLYSINTSDLIEQGYLCPLEYIDRTLLDHNEIPVNKSASDFDLDGYEKKISLKESEILATVAYAKSCSNSVLVFCSSVAQAEHLQSLVDGSAVVSAKTPAKERDTIIQRFKNRAVQVVFNVGVLTTGFDHPSLDCIILLRPTKSIGLYYQMLGRGVRIAPGKTCCKIIDMTSNVKNLGRVETIKLVKEDKWELISETGSWHAKPLYSYIIEKDPPKVPDAAQREADMFPFFPIAET